MTMRQPAALPAAVVERRPGRHGCRGQVEWTNMDIIRAGPPSAHGRRQWRFVLRSARELKSCMIYEHRKRDFPNIGGYGGTPPKTTEKRVNSSS